MALLVADYPVSVIRLSSPPNTSSHSQSYLHPACCATQLLESADDPNMGSAFSLHVSGDDASKDTLRSRVTEDSQIYDCHQLSPISSRTAAVRMHILPNAKPTPHNPTDTVSMKLHPSLRLILWPR